MSVLQNNLEGPNNQIQNQREGKGLIGKYDKDSVITKLETLGVKNREILDTVLNLNNLDFDQIIERINDEDNFTVEQGVQISSLIGDLKFHTDDGSKKIIARDLIYCIEGKVLQ